MSIHNQRFVLLLILARMVIGLPDLALDTAPCRLDVYIYTLFIAPIATLVDHGLRKVNVIIDRVG